MQIHFERSGGFAGMRVTATINTDTLSPDDAQKLHEMMDAADFFNLPSVIRAPTRAADSFQYKVTVTDHGQQHTVETGESAASVELRSLLRQLTILARSRQ